LPTGRPRETNRSTHNPTETPTKVKFPSCPVAVNRAFDGIPDRGRQRS